MSKTFSAVYQDGVFRPEIPQDLPDGTSVQLTFAPTRPVEAKTQLTGPEMLALISKSWAKFNPDTDRPEVTSMNVDAVLYGMKGDSGDAR